MLISGNNRMAALCLTGWRLLQGDNMTHSEKLRGADESMLLLQLQ